MRGLRQYVVLQMILYAFWLAFAGSVTPAILLAGIPVTAVPALLFRHTYRTVGNSALFAGTWHLLFFAAKTIKAMVTASFTIAMYAFRPTLALRSTIIEYNSCVTDRLGLTILSLAITMTPGTIVVDRDGGVLYIHVIAPADRSDDSVRASLAELEHPLVRGLGEGGYTE